MGTPSRRVVGTRSPVRIVVWMLLMAPLPAFGQSVPSVLPDSLVQVWPVGRFYLDGAMYREDVKPMSNGTEFRTARFGVHGFIAQTWEFELEVDVDDEELDFKDLWVARNLSWGARVQVGNFKEPFSLEELTSSRFLTFMERALPNTFAPGRSIGAAVTVPRTFLWVSGGLFGQEADELADSDLGVSEGWAVTGRAVARWFPQADRVVHLGASGTRRRTDARSDRDGRIRFRSYPEAHVDRTRYLNTGQITGTDYFSVVGVEGAAAWGPFSVQGERMVTHVTPQDIADPESSFDGNYVMASWFPTGDSRPYDPAIAEFGPVTPSRDFGAVELAARYSRLDLNDSDAGVEGGQATQWTLGVNWYVSTHVRVALNHVWVNNGPLADGDGDFAGDDDLRIFQARFLIWF